MSSSTPSEAEIKQNLVDAVFEGDDSKIYAFSDLLNKYFDYSFDDINAIIENCFNQYYIENK